MKRGLALSIALLVGCTASEAPNVAAPPAIVFDWLRNCNRDIYRATLDGKDTIRLTSSPGDDQYPTERAGTVVFTSYRDGNGELYAVPSSGGATRRLATTTANETQPALSPAGRPPAIGWCSSRPRTGTPVSLSSPSGRAPPRRSWPIPARRSSPRGAPT